jgi:hypothetical protein
VFYGVRSRIERRLNAPPEAATEDGSAWPLLASGCWRWDGRPDVSPKSPLRSFPISNANRRGCRNQPTWTSPERFSRAFERRHAAVRDRHQLGSIRSAASPSRSVGRNNGLYVDNHRFQSFLPQPPPVPSTRKGPRGAPQTASNARAATVLPRSNVRAAHPGRGTLTDERRCAGGEVELVVVENGAVASLKRNRTATGSPDLPWYTSPHHHRHYEDAVPPLGSGASAGGIRFLIVE